MHPKIYLAFSFDIPKSRSYIACVQNNSIGDTAMQESFSRLWEGYATDKLALQARNRRAKDLRKAGYYVVCFTNANQMKKYDGLGQRNGACCNVYYVDYQSQALVDAKSAEGTDFGN